MHCITLVSHSFVRVEEGDNSLLVVCAKENVATTLPLTLRTFQVDIRNLRYFYIEDEGGSPLVTPVQSEIRAAQHKIVKHLEKAYGIKAKKVKLTRE